MAAGNTYEAIATQTLGSATTTVTFSSIPGTYTDLVVVFQGGITTGPDDIRIRFNSDTGTNYSATLLRGDGSSAISARSSNDTYISWMGYFGTGTAGSVSIVNVNNYSNTTTNKTALNRGSVASNFVNASVGLWRSTAAITSMTLIAGGSTFLSGSIFSLYGIRAA